MAKLDYMGITWKYGFGTKFKWVPWKISGKFPGFPLKAKLHFHQSTRASHIAIWKMGGSWIFSIFETLLSNSFPLTRAGPPVVIPVGPRAPHAGTLNNIRHQTCDMIVKQTSKKEKKCAAASLTCGLERSSSVVKFASNQGARWWRASSGKWSPWWELRITLC